MRWDNAYMTSTKAKVEKPKKTTKQLNVIMPIGTITIAQDMISMIDIR